MSWVSVKKQLPKPGSVFFVKKKINGMLTVREGNFWQGTFSAAGGTWSPEKWEELGITHWHPRHPGDRMPTTLPGQNKRPYNISPEALARRNEKIRDAFAEEPLGLPGGGHSSAPTMGDALPGNGEVDHVDRLHTSPASDHQPDDQSAIMEIIRNGLYWKHPAQTDAERARNTFERLRPYLRQPMREFGPLTVKDKEDALALMELGLVGHGSIHYGAAELAERAFDAFIQHFDIRRRGEKS